MATVQKKEIVDRIADATENTRSTVKSVVQCFLEEIISDLSKNNRLEFRDFGVFEVRERAARSAQNPKTLEPVHVPAKKIVRFRPGRLMTQSVNDSRHNQ